MGALLCPACLRPCPTSRLFKMTSVTGRIKLSSFVTKENLNYSVSKACFELFFLLSFAYWFPTVTTHISYPSDRQHTIIISNWKDCWSTYVIKCKVEFDRFFFHFANCIFYGRTAWERLIDPGKFFSFPKNFASIVRPILRLKEL